MISICIFVSIRIDNSIFRCSSYCCSWLESSYLSWSSNYQTYRSIYSIIAISAPSPRRKSAFNTRVYPPARILYCHISVCHQDLMVQVLIARAKLSKQLLNGCWCAKNSLCTASGRLGCFFCECHHLICNSAELFSFWTI
ncbi:unnamed protein product [Albugo candida]|uniref:Uncharacterized protein n=1 Tax=Albugo candida TaxID=65357 RepID=A0A024GU95_9STRA|nr:unnamed protein product [Albugo candida]|eukprot:CCI50311.1 unnamed protein product [Albugo candida]